MSLISSFIAGLLFGVGLILSGMTNPAIVIGFLDITGEWSPSLAFVMLGAVMVSFFAFRVAGNRPKTILSQQISLPTKQNIDTPLIMGSVTFGVGWGLAGYCPGPALASIATGYKEPVIFVAAMLLGMAIYEVIRKIQFR